MFQAIIEDRNASKVEKDIDGYSGFLFYDDNGMPLVAMHWQHRFNHMVGRYNDIYRVQMPNITLHVCRHTYCSNMAIPSDEIGLQTVDDKAVEKIAVIESEKPPSSGRKNGCAEAGNVAPSKITEKNKRNKYHEVNYCYGEGESL